LLRTGANDPGALRRRVDLDRSDPRAPEPLEAGRSRPGRRGHGEEGLTEHCLARKGALTSQGCDGSGDDGRGETGEVGEPLAKPEEPLGGGMGTELLEVASGPSDPSERGGVMEHGRGGDGPTYDPNEERGTEGSMDDPTEGRDAGPGADLEAAPQDRGDAPETASAEEVREMRDLDREGGRERTGGAHSEPLSDREFVRQADGEGSRFFGSHAAGHVLGNGPRTSPVGDHPNAGTGPRGEPSLRP